MLNGKLRLLDLSETNMPEKRRKTGRKHLCYYGYAKSDWYTISCPVCKKTHTGNLPHIAAFLLTALASVSAITFLLMR